jgi:hypothetical protein
MNRISQKEPAELLSALADGECRAEEVDQLLRAWSAEPGLSDRFQRICATRAALRGVEFGQPVDVCADVMAAIAPRRRSLAALGWRARRRVARPAVGLALAASLGALMTFSAIRVGDLGVGFSAGTPQVASRSNGGDVASAAPAAANAATGGAQVIPAAASVPTTSSGSPASGTPTLVTASAVNAEPSPDAGLPPVTQVSWSDLRPQAASPARRLPDRAHRLSRHERHGRCAGLCARGCA